MLLHSVSASLHGRLESALALHVWATHVWRVVDPLSSVRNYQIYLNYSAPFALQKNVNQIKFRRRWENTRNGSEFLGNSDLKLLLHLKRFRLKSCVCDYFMNIWWIKIKISPRASGASFHILIYIYIGCLVQRKWQRADKVDRFWQSRSSHNIFSDMKPTPLPLCYIIFFKSKDRSWLSESSPRHEYFIEQNR